MEGGTWAEEVARRGGGRLDTRVNECSRVKKGIQGVCDSTRPQRNPVSTSSEDAEMCKCDSGDVWTWSGSARALESRFDGEKTDTRGGGQLHTPARTHQQSTRTCEVHPRGHNM